jgi:hypothetical protein
MIRIPQLATALSWTALLVLLLASAASAQLGTSAADPWDDVECQCRSDVESDNGSIEVGYVGKFRGQKLYYEVWNIPNAAGVSADYVLLRTDTVWNDSFDLCLPSAEQSEPQPVRPQVKRLDSNGIYALDARLLETDLPTVYQILIEGEYGYQNYGSLNKSKDQRIYVRGNSLYIKHWESPRYDDATLVLDRYVWKRPPRFFVFQSRRVLKREPWE